MLEKSNKWDGQDSIDEEKQDMDTGQSADEEREQRKERCTLKPNTKKYHWKEWNQDVGHN